MTPNHYDLGHIAPINPYEFIHSHPLTHFDPINSNSSIHFDLKHANSLRVAYVHLYNVGNLHSGVMGN